jgi:hypothetical protein
MSPRPIYPQRLESDDMLIPVHFVCVSFFGSFCARFQVGNNKSLTQLATGLGILRLLVRLAT